MVSWAPQLEVFNMTLVLPLACIGTIALLAIYVPTIYIRRTNEIQKLLTQIEANTRK